MKIGRAQLVESDGRVMVAYRFETPTRPESTGELWFRVRACQRDWLATGPEPAVAALIFLAMALGEDVEVSESISPRFHYGFGRFIEHFCLWLPQLFKPVRLIAPQFAAQSVGPARVVASCFSGGVDSFHTLYNHLPGHVAPGCEMTHFFFVHGFDIPTDNPVYGEIAAEFSALAAAMNLEFMGMETNARKISDPFVSWIWTHGAIINACGLLLANGIRNLIIPSTNRQSLLFAPCGSNPVTDPMLATESLQVIHYGSHASRIQKIREIELKPEAQQHLRVCFQNASGVRNCGRCVKCLKVMMPLALAGVLENFSGFPPLPPWCAIDPDCFRPVNLAAYAPEISYADELRELAFEIGDLAAAHSIEMQSASHSPLRRTFSTKRIR